MPKNTRPNQNVRKGLPLTDRGWERLAQMGEYAPLTASVIISELARLKVEQHQRWVIERRLWEDVNSMTGIYRPLFSGEPFLGEFPWTTL